MRVQSSHRLESNPHDSFGSGGSSAGANTARHERHVSDVHITIGNHIGERTVLGLGFSDDALQSTADDALQVGPSPS